MQRRQREIVHIGREGWLFLIGGTNRVIAQYRSTWAWWRRLRGWARRIEERDARARRLGIRYLHIVVPEKLSVYDDRTDGLRYDPRKSPARRLAGRLADSPAFVDLVGPMRSARDGPVPLYFLTDTHWSHEGCFLAFRVLMRACGALVPPDLADRPRIASERVCDLGEKVPARPSERTSLALIARDAVRSHANTRVESYEAEGRAHCLHRGANVVFRNESPAADPRTLVLFGDSYAHFAPFMLTGLLAESFREVHFVWSASLDWSYVEKVRPDLLVTEIAERFMIRVPDDRYDLASHSAVEDHASFDGLPPLPVPETI